MVTLLQTNRVTSTLLTAGDPSAVEIVNRNGISSALLVCDHASCRVPGRLDNLGLDSLQLSEHIGWDPGAAHVARLLSVHLDAPLVLSGYSRLVIDCNRAPLSEESIAHHSDGVPIPGNQVLTQTEKYIRINEIFQPYHGAISRLLDSRTNRSSMLLSIHSFTPILNGLQRPWHIGVSSGHDRRLAELMLKVLVHSNNFIVGDNEPYPIDDDIDYTLPVHGDDRGLPNVMFEIRQDEIRTEADISGWAERLAEAYLRIEAEL